MASIQGWGRETWNSGAWSEQAPVSVTGIGLTSSAGTETVTTDQNISVSGNPLTSTAGTAVGTGIANAVITNGASATSARGDVSLSTDQNISVSGNPLTSTTGTFAISGDGQTTVVVGADTAMQSSVGQAEADPEFVVFPTGNAMTSAVGTVGTSVFLTGIGMTSTIGDAEQETLYAAPSVEATASEGNVNIRTDVAFTITGNSVTSATGTLQGTFWSQVDDSNSGITWTEVHKAA